MCAKRTTRLAAASWALAAMAQVVASATPAIGATDRLPDLIVRPELLQVTEIDRVTQPERELLRLTAGAANVGEGPLELRGGAIVDPTRREVAQRIYRSDGTWFDRLAGEFTYHPEHGHVHFDEWMTFRLREAPPGGAVGGIVAEGEKVSFCLVDGAVHDPANPYFVPRETYSFCGFDVQGISPGWADIYGLWLPDQWIDITGVPDGEYWLEVEVDGENRLIEESDANNVARVPIRLRPPDATPDRYEENDAFDAVAVREEGGADSPNLGPIESRRTLAGLSLEDGLDLFGFRLPATAAPGAFVGIETPWSAGDLDLTLYGEDRIPLAASMGPSSEERIALDGLADRTLFVGVSSRAGPNPDYTLTLDPGAACAAEAGGAAPDADLDEVADACDNCPDAGNPGQADSNRDGAGDACQPALTLAGIVEDGGERLEVRATARDPLGGGWGGRLEISGPWRRPLELHDALETPDCDLAFRPDGDATGGIAFAYASTGEPYLFDADSVMGCGDGSADYQLAPGACPQSITAFDAILALADMSLPRSICLRRMGEHAGGSTLWIDSFDRQRLRGSLDTWTDRLLDLTFEGALPREIPLASMAPGQVYDLLIEVTNGSTPPVSARASFLYSGESTLLVNMPPTAAIAAPAVVECDRPAAGAVTLDALASSDPDAAPGEPDRLERFDWFEDPGGPEERLLGTGPRLDLVLPLGEHRVGVRVTDSAGESNVAEAMVTVSDTVAPILRLTVRPATLWPPDHRLVPVVVLREVEDRCDPSPRVRLVSARSSDPDDAPGGGDGATIGDVRGADLGTADFELWLRAERAGKGSARLYTLGYAAVDAAGNVGAAEAVVPVVGP